MKNKKLIILITAGLALLATVLVFRYGNFGAELLWNISNGGKWLLPLVVVSSLIDSINPCAFSILLITVAFLFSVGGRRSKILKIGGFYIFGIFIAYTLIGLGILKVLHLFDTPHFMAKVGAGLIILFGLVILVDEIFPRFPIKFKIPHIAHSRMSKLIERGSIVTAFVLGALVGLCAFPCSGGPYLMILGLLHDTSTYINGFSYLILYNLIFVLPLVIMLFIASDKGLLERAKEWQQKEKRLMKVGGGIAMIILGIVIFLL